MREYNIPRPGGTICRYISCNYLLVTRLSFTFFVYLADFVRTLLLGQDFV